MADSLDDHRARLRETCGAIVSLIVDDPSAADEILAAVAQGVRRARERADHRLGMAEGARTFALALLEPKRLSPEVRDKLGAGLGIALQGVDDYAPPVVRWARDEFGGDKGERDA